MPESHCDMASSMNKSRVHLNSAEVCFDYNRKDSALFKRTFYTCFLSITLVSLIVTAVSVPVQAISPSAVSHFTKTEKQALPPDQCSEIKRAVPAHASDPNVCMVIITHTFEGPSSLLKSISTTNMKIKPDAVLSSCPNGGGNTVTAYDDLSYGILWTEELYTQFVYNGIGCAPSLNKLNGSVKYAIIGLASLSQSTDKRTVGTNVTGYENIVSNNAVGGVVGAQISSCQSRSLDDQGNWPYYSNLYAQDC